MAAIVCLLAFTGPWARAQTILVPWGADWRYADRWTPGWQETNFNDSAWASGPAPLGYGHGDEATVVSNAWATPPITTFYRHCFVRPNAGPFLSATLRVLRDDGAVVYLNGIYRQLALGGLSILTAALQVVDGAKGEPPSTGRLALAQAGRARWRSNSISTRPGAGCATGRAIAREPAPAFPPLVSPFPQ
jgi:hypothetical protein